MISSHARGFRAHFIGHMRMIPTFFIWNVIDSVGSVKLWTC